MTERPTWMADGACRDHHPELFFADGNRAVAMAKEVCADCPALQLCLEWAIETNERWGIFGGHTYAERLNLKRNAQYAAKRDAA